MDRVADFLLITAFAFAALSDGKSWHRFFFLPILPATSEAEVNLQTQRLALLSGIIERTGKA